MLLFSIISRFWGNFCVKSFLAERKWQVAKKEHSSDAYCNILSRFIEAQAMYEIRFENIVLFFPGSLGNCSCDIQTMLYVLSAHVED